MKDTTTVVKLINVEKGSEEEKGILETKCSIHSPTALDKDKEYDRFIVIGFKKVDDGILQSELLSFCPPVDLLRAESILHKAIKTTMQHGEIDIVDMLEVIESRMNER